MELKNGIGDLLEAPHRQVLETTILPEYLKNRRWFASKDQLIKSVRVAEAGLFLSDAGEILFCEIEVELPTRTERYQLPLGVGFSDQDSSPLVETLKLTDVILARKHGALTDAFSLDLLAISLIHAVKTNVVINFADADIHCSSLDGFDRVFPKNFMDIRRLSAEQSNSSLVIGGSVIMKLIRRVMYGINPEVEMVRFLTENRYAHTPPLLGEVQHIRRDGVPYSMYVVQKFISNQGDAWSYTLDALRAGPDGFRSYEGFASAIGTRLAELHQVLSRPTTNEAFAPREAAEEDVARWIEAATYQLNAAFSVVEDCGNFSKSTLRYRDFMLSHRNQVSAALVDLAHAGIGSLMTRIHGDFHLGQVLVADRDAYIIDFEGEPSKSLDVRRGKYSPLRDVAGLLRSLDYAVGASGTSSTDFGNRMSIVFLDAYRTVLNNTTRRWIESGDQQTRLLDLFLLEKCAYEICYEAANRPEWLAIPLRGFVDIVARVLGLPEVKDA